MTASDLELHHVGRLVTDIAASAELCRRRFGYTMESGVIHDPVQSAYVQFFRLPGDRVFLELVSPDGPQSKLSAALQKGESLHHLCFATGDIEAACASLRSEGMTLVKSPVSATAFQGRRIAWLMGRDRFLVELVEKNSGDGL